MNFPRPRLNPGVAGWVGVGVSVALADGIAKAIRQPTMSDEFCHHFFWAAPIATAVFAHLLLHERKTA